MRILQLANHCDEIGNGIVNVAVDLACLQAQAGHSVAFASTGGSYVGLLSRYGVQHLTMQSYGRSEATLAQLLQHPTIFGRAFADLRSILREYRPDIVHAHMITGAVLAFCATQGLSTALVTTVHNVFQLKSVLMGLGRRVIVVSDAVGSTMRHRGIPRHKLQVVRNGPLGSPRRPRNQHASCGLRLQPPAIVAVAGLYRRKGIHDLISAFEFVSRTVPAASLHIVGEGPDRAIFERQIQEAGLQHKVRLHGFVRDPGPYLACADIFVMPSLRESFPLAIAEAREAGCAIVATDVDGIPEALDGGAAGILVPVCKPEVMATQLIRLLLKPDELAIWRSRAMQNVEWLHCNRVASETTAVYEDALGVPRSSQHIVSLDVTGQAKRPGVHAADNARTRQRT
jgi:glycosyltransferase involved in cell wall biosynthesis